MTNEPQRSSDGWNEWSRYVLAELKRMNDAIIALTTALDVLREAFAKHIVQHDALTNSAPNRLAQTAAETAIKWAVMFGIGLLAWAAFQYINSGFRLP